MIVQCERKISLKMCTATLLFFGFLAPGVLCQFNLPLPEDVTATVAEDVTLTWDIMHFSHISNILWSVTLDSSPSTSFDILVWFTASGKSIVQNNYNVENTTDGSLTLKNVALNNTGVYKIFVTYKATSPGDATAEDTVNVTVQATSTQSTPENTDCCCCKDKKKRDAACGTTLALCICVMAVLVFCFHAVFPPNRPIGAILLICAIILSIAALTGLILSAICLSKECCSGIEDSCKAKNCFKDNTIAGFSMAGISVVGTIVVVICIRIFLNPGNPGNPGDGWDCMSHSRVTDAPNKSPDNKDKQDQEKHRAMHLPPLGQQGYSAYSGGGKDVVGKKERLPPIEQKVG
ncbi:uncharacterized protein LOC128234910 [Mya arenaria]|uniref:uncharacterized protein LOC128234910 n=1 Tax=Mya arenaria TaxID=6604 RepID=UPI0022DF6596|nr:uncharacterized protein LOC128234910 [Mya arenaria]